MDKNQILELILKAAEAYYNGNEIMSDAEYDALLDNARKLINLMPSRSEDIFQEEKSIKRFEMRLYKLKKTYNK